MWNGQDISIMFRDTSNRKIPAASLEFAWQSARGISLKAVAHANPTTAMNQYDFFIDGKSIMSIQPKDSAIQNRVEEAKQDISPVPSEDCSKCERVRAASSDFTGSGGNLSGNGLDDTQQQTRLAAAGFTYTYDMEDELRSDLYSSTLDTLRDQVSAIVPETEVMLSRAIINAYSEDHDSDTSGDSLSLNSDKNLDPAEVEADVLGEAFEYLKWSRDFISSFDMDERKLEYMQIHVEQMVAHVRHERLKPSAACRIMHRIAAILSLEVTKEPTHDTVMFEKLNSLTTTHDIIDAMEPYGDIAVAAVSKNHEGFGFCRFTSTNVVDMVCESAVKGAVQINGRSPIIFSAFDSPYTKEIEAKVCESRQKDYDHDFYDDVDTYNRDHIDPSDDCIEATYTAPSRGSLNLSALRHNAYSQQSLESSTSSYIYQRPSYKSSSGTMTSLSTLDVDDFEPNNFIPMSVLD